MFVVSGTFLPLQEIVEGLESHGIYTLLDMHQDVLWKAGPNDDKDGYWGGPPWLKHQMPLPYKA